MKIIINFFLIMTLFRVHAHCSEEAQLEEPLDRASGLGNQPSLSPIDQTSLPDFDTLPAYKLSPAQKIGWCIGCCCPCICMMGQIMRCFPCLKPRRG